MSENYCYYKLLEAFAAKIDDHLMERNHKGDFVLYGRNAPIDILALHAMEEAGEIAAQVRMQHYGRTNVNNIISEVLDLGALAFALWLKCGEGEE